MRKKSKQKSGLLTHTWYTWYIRGSPLLSLGGEISLPRDRRKSKLKFIIKGYNVYLCSVLQLLLLLLELTLRLLARLRLFLDLPIITDYRAKLKVTFIQINLIR